MAKKKAKKKINTPTSGSSSSTGSVESVPSVPSVDSVPSVPSTRSVMSVPSVPSLPSVPSVPALAANRGVPSGPRAALPAVNVRGSGDDILVLAETHIGEPYVLGARAPMGNSGWTGPWDCAEFASWCVFQASGVLFGASPRDNPTLADAWTGFWTEQTVQENAVVSVDVAARTPGACVLRSPTAARTGHIVISDGTGGTVEAHSTDRGVIRHTLTNRRWDTGVLVPGVQYFSSEEGVELAPPSPIIRVTDPLTRGSLVRAAQAA